MDTPDGATYYVVTTDGESWSVYFESLEGDMVTVRTDISDPDVAKAVAGDHNVNRNPNAYDRTSARRKFSALTWEQDGVGAYADKGDNTAYHIFKYPGDEYFSIKYYSDRMNGDGRIFDYAATLDEAKSIAEQEDASGRTARRKRASLAWTDGAPGFFEDGTIQPTIRATGPDGTLYIIAPENYAYTLKAITGSDITVLVEGVGEIQAKQVAEDHANGRTARRKRASITWVPADNMGGEALTGTSDDGTSFDLYYGDDDLYHVVAYYPNGEVGADQTYETLADAKNHTEWATRSAHRQASRRKQAWSLGADGMTYTSDVAQDGFDCPACGTGNKLGFSRCACGKQWNSYTIEGANGERRMVAREVEARPEAVLANRRRQARRKRAASEWFQRGNSERIELPGGVWCEVSEMSGKPGGPYGFIYGDGESDSGHVYDIGFPTMEQAKAAALDEVGFGGITANRRRQAARRRAQAGRESSNPAYNAGRRAAQRNLPVNPAAPLAYLTGYRDYLRSAIKRG